MLVSVLFSATGAGGIEWRVDRHFGLKTLQHQDSLALVPDSSAPVTKCPTNT